MKRHLKYELNLNFITVVEAMRAQNFDKYKELVIQLLRDLGIYYEENDILKYYEKKSMEEVIKKLPEKYFPVNADEPDSPERLWFDIADSLIIQKEYLYYDTFFAYYLGHNDLLEIDKFLEYQLHFNYFASEPEFLRFLEIILQKHSNIIPDKYTGIVLDWILERKKSPSATIVELKPKTKGKPKREPGDNLTALTQEQTVLLIHFLKEKGIIQKGSYLTNKDAGEAFSLLTGYSSESLRISLGKNEMELLFTRKNLSELRNHLTAVTNLIDSEIKNTH